MDESKKIAVIGLGYVGLPLALAFSKHYPVIGFDKKESRILSLREGNDLNGEYTAEELISSGIQYTDDEQALQGANVYLVAVPTPVTKTNQPDLRLLLKASKIIGSVLKKGDLVVYESTVYPGATEEECIPLLEKSSGLVSKIDFKVGYSPERINPGDKAHTFKNTIKIVAGQDKETLERVASLYGKVVQVKLYRAESIKVAEAAKVIENTQRDLNVSLINEIALILHRLKIDTKEVLDAAATKWNFLDFRPGFVGGHCIGVDPYYLTYKAKQVGFYPDVILAGRKINDMMGKFVAEKTVKNLIRLGVPIKRSRVAVLGITFKENCSDVRNSRVVDLIRELHTYDLEILVHDPLANAELVKKKYGIDLIGWEEIHDVVAIVLTVAHKEYVSLDPKVLKEKLNYRGLLMDIKSILDRASFKDSGVSLWRL